MATKNLQVRLDDKLKKKAEHIFQEIGLDTPTAIRVFFAKVVAIGGIPFSLHSEDHYSPEQLKRLDRLAADAKKGKGVSRSFSSIDEFLEDLRA